MPMNARDFYGLIVRIAGSAFVVFALFDLVRAASTGLGFPLGSTDPVSNDLIGAFEWGVIGVAMLIAAERIVRLVYGRPKPSSEE
jgi:hypothetical protein